MDKLVIGKLFEDLLSSYESTREYSIYHNSSEPEGDLKRLEDEIREYKMEFKEALEK